MHRMRNNGEKGNAIIMHESMSSDGRGRRDDMIMHGERGRRRKGRCNHMRGRRKEGRTLLPRTGGEGTTEERKEKKETL